MNRFDQQLMRLKEALGVVRDNEVAEALGMSKAALSNRKRSESFPDEKLAGLRERFPNLDVAYVLTGERWDADETLMQSVFFQGAVAHSDPSLSASAARSIRNQHQALLDALKHKQVRELLGILAHCDEAAIGEVLLFAARRMGSTYIGFHSRDSNAISAHHAPGAGKMESTSKWIKSRPETERVLILTAVDEAHRSPPVEPSTAKAALKKFKAPPVNLAMTATPTTAARKSGAAGATGKRSAKKSQRA